MNQKNKELLLKDLSARVPYGVFVEYDYGDSVKRVTKFHGNYLYLMMLDKLQWKDLKPYLRPLSSMTEKEENEFKKIFELELKAIESPEGHTIESAASSAFTIDFYNKYNFDYRGLIEMGLAIEVTKENNPYKE